MMENRFICVCFFVSLTFVCGSVILNKFCKLKKLEVICTGRNLDFIPKFPKFVKVVILNQTNLQHIGEDGFINLTNNYITKLFLTDNHITFIHQLAFRNLTSLTSLSISDENILPIDNIKSVLNNMQTVGLCCLYFHNNNWNQIPMDMFKNFERSSVTELQITGNNMMFINCSVFIPLKSLVSLVLTNNSLQTITLTGIPKVRKLSLNINLLSKIPKFCSAKGNSLLEDLTVLDLTQSNIRDIGEHSFRCLPKVQTLRLNDISIGRLNNNIFSYMSSLQTLFLMTVGHPLKYIGDFAFNSSSLSTLKLVKTKFHFDRMRFNPKTIFSSCPNLTVLDLTDNYLPTNGSILQQMFAPLTKLKVLNLLSTGLLSLQPMVFPKLKSLKRICLNSNKISNLDNGAEIFYNMTSLERIELSNNRIKVIHQNSFPFDMLVSLNYLDLSMNPFLCTCDLYWFTEWIKVMPIQLHSYPYYYKCENPAELNGLFLREYVARKKSCPPWNPLFTVAIVLASFGIVITMTIITAVKCHINIKNCLYLLRVNNYRRKGYSFLNDGDNFEYHAFVVYCSADEKWVHQILLQKLEKEQDIKLCIHQREFEVGETITGNIDNFLQRCRKVIIVLSNEFAKSEWCQWEVDVVHERRRRQGKHVFVLIMLQNIDSRHMTSHLRTLLHSAPYLRYQKDAGEDLFWKAVIKSLHCPIGNPPIAVL